MANFHGHISKELEEILKPMDMSIKEIIKICDRFTHKKLFLKDSSGNLIKDESGNLTKINYDNL